MRKYRTLVDLPFGQANVLASFITGGAEYCTITVRCDTASRTYTIDIDGMTAAGQAPLLPTPALLVTPASLVEPRVFSFTFGVGCQFPLYDAIQVFLAGSLGSGSILCEMWGE